MKNETQPGVVYIVHHIDTEGPLHEPVAESFKRIEATFGIQLKIAKTESNLRKLALGQLTVGNADMSRDLAKILDPHLMNLHSNWKKIGSMLKKILSKGYRDAMKDSFGGGWIFNWHIMDHIGFKTNERGRDLGYLKVFNFYEKMLKQTRSTQDAVHWHFHPISFFREAHIAAGSYENSYPEIHQVICRRLIEKSWFPKVNRAGFHTERPDSSWFLEQWLPFDPSNQALLGEEKQTQKDAINGRFGDWSGAPHDWSVYHPDFYDWRKPGAMRRTIARILNLHARFRNISESEIEKAFTKAKSGENVYLGVCNHDWRDMAVEIDGFRKILAPVAKRYPDVKFKFSESVEAFRKVLNYSPEAIKDNAIDFDVELTHDVLHIKMLRGESFGPQPYLAMKTLKGDYFHDNLDFGKTKKDYFFTFDRTSIPISMIDKIGIAANDIYGNTCINIIEMKKGKAKIKKFKS